MRRCHRAFHARQISSSSLEARRGAIEAFYRELAKNYLPERVRELAAAHGFQYARVRVKNQKTRWGSCSSKGNINLNLRLMMAPEQAIDYVIVHELCHLQVDEPQPGILGAGRDLFSRLSQLAQLVQTAQRRLDLVTRASKGAT